MSVALEVRGLTRRFGKLVAVDDASFEIRRGEILGFIGPNGAGKTTTMRVCATLDLPDEGDVLIDGVSVVLDPRGVRRRLGFMPDSYGAYVHTTVADYLDFFARTYGLRGKDRARMLAYVKDFTGLTPLEHKLMTSLSKGMKQRLCLAKTLLHDPALLILDEPAAGLDPHARVELRELVKALAGLGKAVMISSHILTELSQICTSVAVIEAGRIRATGTVDDVIRRARTQHQRVFVRSLAPIDALLKLMLETPGVETARPERGGVVLEVAGAEDDLARLVRRLVEAGMDPIEFSPKATDLEDVFLSLTAGTVQ
ncbi:MAG: ABC transporter ATP-binding protein [Planctomycetes bacterium]|nr:ABC transporter ATP-binding protein [Planctomycetota bacterium]MCB9902987.1 ABC transporter ATP-binding protein [Planctomycetota bacterium]